jgi:type IV secretion system protein VirB1
MLDVLALATVCCPEVAPTTMRAIVQYESRTNPLAIHINGPVRLSRQPATLSEAVETAHRLTAAHLNFDSGLGQINSENVRRFHASWEEVFKPCSNLALSARILTPCYTRTLPTHHQQQRLAMALSCYNTGNYHDGFNNGYVENVYRTAAHSMRR